MTEYTRAELAGRCRREDAAFVIDNVVYDVTTFLDDHPGGHEVLLDNAGRDASKCFRDVGHTDDARAWMRRFVVGRVAEADRWPVAAQTSPGGAQRELTLAGALAAAGPPLALAALAAALYPYLFP